MFKRFLKFIAVFVIASINSFVYAQDDNIPPEFIFNQSQIQGGYLFLSADISGVDLAEDDWIGAFNGDVCVGAKQWNLSERLGELCEIAVMGVDDTEYTSGYLEVGDIITFKVYDASANRYYLATPLLSIPFGGNLSYEIIDSISVVDDCAGELGGYAFLGFSITIFMWV